MFMQKIVDKILEKKAKEIIGFAKEYIETNKEELILKLKTEIENYVLEHKEEIIKIVKDEITDLVIKALKD